MFKIVNMILRTLILFTFVIASPLIFVIAITLSKSFKEAIEITIGVLKGTVENG